MQLKSRLAGVQLRSSRLADAADIFALLDDLRDMDVDGMPTSSQLKAAKVRSTQDVVDLIQSSFLCVTATTTWTVGNDGATTDVVSGFLALGHSPRLYAEDSRGANGVGGAEKDSVFPSRVWDDVLHSGAFAGQLLNRIHPSTALWGTLMIAPPCSALTHVRAAAGAEQLLCTDGFGPQAFSSARLARELLSVALSVSHQTSTILWAFPEQTGVPARGSPVNPPTIPQADLLQQELHAVALQPAVSEVRPDGFMFGGAVLQLPREQVIPRLVLRSGRAEDYDDFVPLLVRGDGVVTELPDDFYLEEVLKDQDDTHKVAVAEDPVTHEVVGLVCAHVLSPEELQHFVWQYAVEPFNKLRPLTKGAGRSTGKGGAGGAHFTARVDFLYFDGRYDGSAQEVVSYLFTTMFPSCEYVLLTLPHAFEEQPILKEFLYVPIRQYQAHNSRGEFVSVPPGLWLCGRQSFLGVERYAVEAIRTPEGRATAEEFLQLPSLFDLPDGLAEAVREDLCLAHEKYRLDSLSPALPLPEVAVVQLVTRGESGAEDTARATDAVIGLASVRRLSGEELYALKANYDVDAYVSLYAHTGCDYTATDLSEADSGDARPPPLPEMRAVMVRAMYVRPAFRALWTRFLAREVLRLFEVELAVVLTRAQENPFHPLLCEAVPIRPRRVLESSPHGPHAPTGAAADCPAGEASGPLANLSENDAAANGASAAQLASLHLLSARFLGDCKRRVYARVVVVGASATGLSVLHALLRTPFVTFANLVLISTDGLPPHPNSCATLWESDHMEFLEREYLSLQLGQPVRVVVGTAVDVDRTNRFVSVDNGTYEPYDYLVLASGRQHCPPPSIRQLLQVEGRTGKKSVLALSGQLALDRVRHALAELDANPGNVANVMVYGSGLDALATVSALIDEHLSPQRIVVCARDAGVPSYIDEAAYNAASTLLRSMGVNMLRGYDVGRMEFDDENNLTSVILTPSSTGNQGGQHVELSCCLVLCVDDKDIDANILSALNKRSIVFDGRVIVNRHYQTTDPRILAAGPVAMWTRRYGTTAANFEDFSAREVGASLAEVLLANVGFEEYCSPYDGQRVDDEMSFDDGGAKTSSPDGIREGGAQTLSDQAVPPVPMYDSPVARRLRLPGGYHFFSVQCVRFDAAACDAVRCDTIDEEQFTRIGSSPSTSIGAEEADAATGPAGSRQSLLTVYVNRSSRRMDAVVYFGLESPQCGNYRALVGLPETVLNLVYRCKEAQQRAAAAAASSNSTAHNPHSTGAGLADGTSPTRGTATVDLPPSSGLTAGVRRGQLDLVEYLRLPHLQTVMYDRFSDFFRQLQRRAREHEQVMRLRERVLTQHKMDRTLAPEEFTAYQRELTEKRSEFRRATQLALITFLHEQKFFMPQRMYLPAVGDAVAEAKSKSGALMGALSTVS